LTPDLDQVIANITPADPDAIRAALSRQSHLTKPPGSLGRLEELSVQLAGIFGTEQPVLRDKTIVVATGDHGVVSQGVTGYPQEVTRQMVSNFLAGGAAINVIARQLGINLVIVDAGTARPLPAHPDLRMVRVGPGTANITAGPAMTPTQARQCLTSGIQLANEAALNGADLIGVGDMGIGNTTASSAIASALTRRSPEETTGRGTGRNVHELQHKIGIVRRALSINQPNPDAPIDVLAKIGGFEIGVIAGVILGTASARRAIVLDGFASGAAALIAYALCPYTRDYMIAAHLSAEKGHRVVLSHLGLSPVLDLGMRLGEGTGAALAMPIIEAAASCLSDMATFSEAGVSNRPSGSQVARST